MKVERNIFAALGLFYAVMGLIYFFFFGYEWIGLFVLLLSGVLSWMIAAYVGVIGRKNDRQVFDNPDAEVVDGAGTLGFFPPHSIWPFWCALVLAVVALGPVFGWWLTILGFGLGVVVVSGWVYEYYRGDYAH